MLHTTTPLHELHGYRRGPRVRLKLESIQPAGSFKLRGIGALCEDLAHEGATRLVSSSGGNAGYATAWCGRELQLETLVVTPHSTALQVIEQLQQLGARVVVHGEDWDAAHREALRAAEEPGSALVHPFDDERIWAGHATIVDELNTQLSSPPEAIVVAVGGGGLLAGIDHGLRNHGWEDTDLIAVETTGAASFNAALSAGTPTAIDAIDTVATTLGARQVCSRALSACHHRIVHSVLVEDQQAIAACLRFADEHRMLVEPSCGAALATVYDDTNFFQSLTKLSDYDDVIVVVCGGIGVDLKLLRKWAAEFGLAHQVNS